MNKKLFKVDPKSDEMVPIHPRFFSHYNPPPHYYEENTGGSITNPDFGMTIQEMIDKYVRGESLPGHEIFYDENEDNVISKKEFDLSDLTRAQDVINSRSIVINKESEKKVKSVDNKGDASKPPVEDEEGTTKDKKDGLEVA